MTITPSQTRPTDEATMSAMDRRIEREITIDARIETVWRTITDPSQIPLWFADAADLDARPGAAGSLSFTNADNDMDPMTVALTVVDVDPPHRFSFRWTYPDGVVPAEGNSLLATFTLTALDDRRTLLRVAETGLELMPLTDDEKDAYAADHNGGWAFHLGRMQAHFAEDEPAA